MKHAFRTLVRSDKRFFAKIIQKLFLSPFALIANKTSERSRKGKLPKISILYMNSSAVPLKLFRCLVSSHQRGILLYHSLTGDKYVTAGRKEYASRLLSVRINIQIDLLTWSRFVCAALFVQIVCD